MIRTGHGGLFINLVTINQRMTRKEVMAYSLAYIPTISAHPSISEHPSNTKFTLAQKGDLNMSRVASTISPVAAWLRGLGWTRQPK
jgi:hypothetical protein